MAALVAHGDGPGAPLTAPFLVSRGVSEARETEGAS